MLVKKILVKKIMTSRIYLLSKFKYLQYLVWHHFLNGGALAPLLRKNSHTGSWTSVREMVHPTLICVSPLNLLNAYNNPRKQSHAPLGVT